MEDRRIQDALTRMLGWRPGSRVTALLTQPREAAQSSRVAAPTPFAEACEAQREMARSLRECEEDNPNLGPAAAQIELQQEAMDSLYRRLRRTPELNAKMVVFENLCQDIAGRMEEFLQDAKRCREARHWDGLLERRLWGHLKRTEDRIADLEHFAYYHGGLR